MYTAASAMPQDRGAVGAHDFGGVGLPVNQEVGSGVILGAGGPGRVLGGPRSAPVDVVGVGDQVAVGLHLAATAAVGWGAVVGRFPFVVSGYVLQYEDSWSLKPELAVGRLDRVLVDAEDVAGIGAVLVRRGRWW